MQLPTGTDRRAALLAALAVLALIAGALLGGAPGGDGAPAGDEPPPAEDLVLVDGTDGYLWPYTSRTRSVGGRTLAITVLVRENPQTVGEVLRDRSETEWSGADDAAAVVPPPWGSARGAARFTYTAAGDPGAGRWVESRYQLGTGTYLGSRIHVRAYPARGGDWTALQPHEEYWDWFRLRHTVTSVDAGTLFVERDLRDEPVAVEISREYHGLSGGGSDGWLTVVEFGALALLVGGALPLVERRRALRDAALPVAVAGIVVGVRAVGVAAEGLAPGVDPKLFAGALYPVLVLGPPAAAALLARDRPPGRMALLAGVGLGGGAVLDFGAVGVSAVPVDLALHRVALAAALGLFALGAARRDRRVTAAGGVAWLAVLAASLFAVV